MNKASNLALQLEIIDQNIDDVEMNKLFFYLNKYLIIFIVDT